MGNEFRKTIQRWPFTSDGLQSVPDLPGGDYELRAVYGTVFWSTAGPITATDYASTGTPCARGDVERFKLPSDRRLYIYNPAGCDCYLRQVE